MVLKGRSKCHTKLFQVENLTSAEWIPTEDSILDEPSTSTSSKDPATYDLC